MIDKRPRFVLQKVEHDRYDFRYHKTEYGYLKYPFEVVHQVLETMPSIPVYLEFK
jgi:hypothetical protein